MAGSRKNNAFNVTVGQVKVASNIGDYNNQTPSIRFPNDDYQDAIKDSYKEDKDSYKEDKDFQKVIRKDESYGKDYGTYLKNLKSLDFSKDQGVPFSKDERRVTEAYKGLKGYEGARDIFGNKYTGEVDTAKIESDYAKYQPERDRRVFRKGVEDNLSDFRRQYMKDFRDADYAIRMKEYNADGTEKESNKFIRTYDQQIDRLKDLGANEVLDKFGNIHMRDNYAPNQQDSIRKKATSLASGFKGFGTDSSKGINRSKSRRSGRSNSSSKGGMGTGRAGQGSKKSARGARGSAGSRGRGGTGTGRAGQGSKRGSRGSKGRRCDIRCKIDISPLINSNLVKDDLAEIAYFVQEINK